MTENNITNKNSFLSEIENTVCKHPFITLAIMCLISLCMFTGSTDTAISPVSFMSMFAVYILVVFVIFFIVLKNNKIDILTKNSLFPCAVLLGLAFIIAFASIENNTISVFILASVVSISIFGVWLKTGNINTRRTAIIIIFLGFALRLTYILYTTIYERQHDNGTFGGSGHLAYIEFFWNNPLSLPSGDIRLMGQFYHPPLHHLLEGIFLNIFKSFGVTNIEHICEATQYLTMFYSCICMVIMYKILRFFSIKGFALIAGLSIIAFHPTFIIMSGSINNDILSITFMMASVLNTLYYYKNPTYGNILKIAVCVGCGMMSKLSGWMVAPAIAFIFIVVLIKKRKNILSMLSQWFMFGLVCVPLALWWEIRNLINYNIPINYVWQVSPDVAMNVQSKGIFTRFFDFSPFQFNSVYDQYGWYNCPYYEYNPTIGLFKTSLFDEAQYTSGLDFFAVSLFWINVILALVAIIAMVYMLIKKTNIIDNIMKIFLLLLYIVPVVSYYIFCVAYPYTCTMNIRYTVMSIVIGTLFLSMLLQDIRDTSNIDGEIKTAKKAVIIFGIILISLFCILSIITYIMIGVVPAIYDGILYT